MTPADSFPPARPSLISVTAVGLITLSWDPGPETDLAGYRVWRKGPRGRFSLMTPAPISENTFTDDQVEADGTSTPSPPSTGRAMKAAGPKS